MHCFDGHRVQELNHEGVVRSDAKCFQHGLAPLTLYCLTCNIAICRECRDIAHCPPAHHIEGIVEAAEKQLGIVEALMSQARSKQEQLLDLFKLVDAAQNRLSVSMNRAAATIDESFHMIVRAADEHRRALGKELENAFGAKQVCASCRVNSSPGITAAIDRH
jgi:tripartite motif-containing protein 2/3